MEWWISISLVYCKFHGGDLWSCLLPLISISLLLKALKLSIRGLLKYGNTLGTISLSLTGVWERHAGSHKEKAFDRFQRVKNSPILFRLRSPVKCIWILSCSPDLVRDTRENAFQNSSFFCVNSIFFLLLIFFLQLKYSVMTWEEPGKTNQSWTNSQVFPKVFVRFKLTTFSTLKCFVILS